MSRGNKGGWKYCSRGHNYRRPEGCDLMDGQSRRRGCAQKKQTIHPVELTKTRSLSTGALIMSLTL